MPDSTKCLSGLVPDAGKPTAANLPLAGTAGMTDENPIRTSSLFDGIGVIDYCPSKLFTQYTARCREKSQRNGIAG